MFELLIDKKIKERKNNISILEKRVVVRVGGYKIHEIIFERKGYKCWFEIMYSWHLNAQLASCYRIEKC